MVEKIVGSKAFDALLWIAVIFVVYLLLKAKKIIDPITGAASDLSETVGDGVKLATEGIPTGKKIGNTEIKIPMNAVSGFKMVSVLSKELNKQLTAARKTINDADVYRQTSMSAFHPNFRARVAKGGNVHQFTKGSSENIAEEFYKSVGLIKDDYKKMLDTFKRIKYKTQLSQVAESFQKLYGKNLFDFLKIKMDTPTQTVAFAAGIKYIAGLPVGTIKK